MPLWGGKGPLWCLVQNCEQHNTLPRLSRDGRWECASRSLLRMRNLATRRGNGDGSRMMGPLNYYGNLEEPHKWTYELLLGRHTVHFHRYPRPEVGAADRKPPALPEPPATLLRAPLWLSGVSSPRGVRGPSLFRRRGTLWAREATVQPPAFDARTACLAAYRARLCRNDAPFAVVDAPRPAKDDLRLVSYLYEPGYLHTQTAPGEGAGLFLETHDFPQFMTPLSPDCGGTVWLARWQGEDLAVVAVAIPFGYTLVLEPGAIHGDVTLVGKYLMGMTSDHISMRSADTVFLWSSSSLEPVQTAPPEVAEGHPAAECDPPRTPRGEEDMSIIFDPFSRTFWQHVARTLFALVQRPDAPERPSMV